MTLFQSDSGQYDFLSQIRHFRQFKRAKSSKKGIGTIIDAYKERTTDRTKNTNDNKKANGRM